VLDDALSVSELLCHEPGRGDHRQSSVLELLGLKERQLLGVGRLKVKRIESDVTRDVSVPEKSRLVKGDVLRLDPSDGRSLLLGGSDADGEEHPERNGDLGEVGDGGSGNLRVEEEGGTLDGFSGEEPDGGEHGNASVGELGLAVSSEGVVVGLLGESEGIEESEGLDGTDQGVDDGGGSDDSGSWSFLLGEGREGGSGTDGSKKSGGGREFHGCVVWRFELNCLFDLKVCSTLDCKKMEW